MKQVRMGQKSTSLSLWSCCSLIIFLVTISIFIGWILVPWFIRYQVYSRIILSPDINPTLYSAWIHPPMPVFFEVYLFNVTNPQTVGEGGLPHFAEVGPYVFRENRTKVELHTDEVEDTISYREEVFYHFEEELSQGLRLEDDVISINVPFVAGAIKISELSWPMNEIGRMVLVQNAEPLFIRRSVGQMLFQGWEVPLLKKIDEDVGFSLIPNNTFSYFMGENGTRRGPFTVSRGIKDKSLYAKILRYRNSTELSNWKPGSSCNKIVGTEGRLFTPFIEKSSVLDVFYPEMCRSVYATFVEDSNVNGIPTYRFRAPPSLIDDPRESEETECFCVHIDEEPDKCLKRGAYDIGPCREAIPGAPVAMSPVHFLNASEQFIVQSGLNPDSEKHSPFIDVEPLTGIVLQGSNKLQINLILKPVKDIKALSKIPDMIFPLFWVDEFARIDRNSSDSLNSILVLIRFVEVAGKWCLPSLTILVIAIVVTKKLNRALSMPSLLIAEESKGSHFIPIVDKELQEMNDVLSEEMKPLHSIVR